MNINEILNILADNDVGHYLDEISRVHTYTKHYLLIAEEISNEGVAFLQPMKEHRDAYDHLCRIFALAYVGNSSKVHGDFKEYIVDNLKKAYGHEYRAFFDTADWLTYICRKYIREELSVKSTRRKYEERYDFTETQKTINELPFQIARLRESKDISNEQPILDEVLEYTKTIDNLLKMYGQVRSL